MKRYDYIVYIGRFQPPHVGHLETFTQAFWYTKNVIVVVGSANAARTPKNPFTASERIGMIDSLTSIIHPDVDSRFHFITAEDRLYNDDKWLAYVQHAVKKIVKNGSLALIGHDKGDSAYLKSAFPGVDFIDTGPYSKETVIHSSTIREMMFAGNVSYTESNLPRNVYRRVLEFTKTEEFDLLKGEYEHIIKEEGLVNNLPFGMTFHTADSVVIQSGHILLVQRGEYPGKGLWALPGVHVGHNETVLEAALRALTVETHLKVPDKVLKGSLRGEKRFDHPERSLRARLTAKNARTITDAFFFKLDSSAPLPKNVKAGEGIEKAWWFPLGDVREMRSQLFEDHADIIDFFIG